MASQSQFQMSKQKKEWIRLFFAVCLGIFIGIMGGIAQRPFFGVAAAGLLALLLGGLKGILNRTIGIYSGVASGAILGVVIAVVIVALPGNVSGVASGVGFGAIRGALIGGTFGYLTKANPDEGDPIEIRLLLLFGSIVIGAFLGWIVGSFTGLMLGWLAVASFDIILAFLAGGVVGGFVASHDGRSTTILLGSLLFGLITAVAQFIGGAVSGVLLGAVSGTLVPIIVMVLIGVYGGLHRGGMAPLREALQTPREMLAHGAVPMLMPSMLVGLIVGTAVAGIRAILVIPTALALTGLFLGAFGEVEGRPVNRVTPKAIIELLILGAEQWPMPTLFERVKTNQKMVIRGAAIGGNLGLLGSIIGIWLGQLLPTLMIFMTRTSS